MVTLALLGAVALAPRAARADGYTAPRLVQCIATSQLLVSENGACFAVNSALGGLAYPQDGRLGNISVAPSSVSMAGAWSAGPGQVGGALQVEREAGTLTLTGQPVAVRPLYSERSTQWVAAPALPEIEHAYIDAGTAQTFVRVGKVDGSVADTESDQPFSALGLLESRAAIGSTVQTSEAPSFGGHSLQLVSNMGGGGTIGTALEGMEDSPTAVASWNYAGGPGSGHLTLVDPNVLGSNGARLGFLTGATVKANFLKLRGALASDQTGWWNAMVSTEAGFGALTLAASGEYLRNTAQKDEPQQFGGGVSASTKVGEAVALSGNLNWADDESGDPGYQVGLGVTTALSQSLKLSSQIGLTTGDNDGLPSLPYGGTSISWTPPGARAVSAGFARDEDGGYRLTTAAKNSFN